MTVDLRTLGFGAIVRMGNRLSSGFGETPLRSGSLIRVHRAPKRFHEKMNSSRVLENDELGYF